MLSGPNHPHGERGGFERFQSIGLSWCPGKSIYPSDCKEAFLKLTEVHEVIAGSHPHEWSHIQLWAPNVGAGFHQVWDKTESTDGWELDFDRHTNQLVYRDDVSLTIGWGIKYQGGMTPGFMENYPSADEAEVFFADVFWNNALIHRHPVYSFKSFEQVYLPGPRAVYEHNEFGKATGVKRYEVSAVQVGLTRLVHSAEHEDFDELFARSGFVVTREAD